MDKVNLPFPTPGSHDEIATFRRLQDQLVIQFRDLFPDPSLERYIVVVPSLSLDSDLLSLITGVHHYEERMLFMLMLLRLPRTHLVYVTSQPLDPLVVDYYLHLLTGVPTSHARGRLTLLSCHDASPRPLTEKIIERPLLLNRIRSAIQDPALAHLTVFNSTPLERTLTVLLGIPLYACDPDLTALGSKSGGRDLFRQADILFPDGAEHLSSEAEIVDALAELKARNPDLSKAVVKMNEGFGGEGNAVFSFDGSPTGPSLRPWVAKELPLRADLASPRETWPTYVEKFTQMSGIVEAWVSGRIKRSPSVQCRIDPLGRTSVISTHDQSLGGPSGQTYQGCTFPAAETYAAEIQDASIAVANLLQTRGVIGRFGIDFVSVQDAGRWYHYAIEINLRKGGTTHPFLMLQYLTKGTYDPGRVRYYTPTGQERYYRASDDLRLKALHGLTPHDLIDLAVCEDLHFDAATQQGVVFHLLGAVSEFGKMGVLCIGDTPLKADSLFDKALNTLSKA